MFLAIRMNAGWNLTCADRPEELGLVSFITSDANALNSYQKETKNVIVFVLCLQNPKRAVIVTRILLMEPLRQQNVLR